MTGKANTIEIILPYIDWFLIQRVRQIRQEKGFSQVDLSIEIGFSEGFISKIENPKASQTYNNRQLNEIAKALKVGLSEIYPAEPFREDLVKIEIRVNSPQKLKVGEQNFEILKITPLNEREVQEYNSNKNRRKTTKTFKRNRER